MEDETGGPALPGLLSKRGALRLIQRALVLTGRDRRIRQQIREAQVISLWVLADWDLDWTVSISRGKIEFDRRPSKKPDLVLTWKSADDFFRQTQTGEWKEDAFSRQGDREAWQAASPAVHGFFQKLDGVLRHPVDENGVRLA